MKRIDTSTATSNNRFTEGNGNDILPTALNADWFNNVQEEISNFIEGSGLALDSTRQDQLRDALFRYLLNGNRQIGFNNIRRRSGSVTRPGHGTVSGNNIYLISGITGGIQNKTDLPTNFFILLDFYDTTTTGGGFFQQPTVHAGYEGWSTPSTSSSERGATLPHRDKYSVSFIYTFSVGTYPTLTAGQYSAYIMPGAIYHSTATKISPFLQLRYHSIAYYNLDFLFYATAFETTPIRIEYNIFSW